MGFFLLPAHFRTGIPCMEMGIVVSANLWVTHLPHKILACLWNFRGKQQANSRSHDCLSHWNSLFGETFCFFSHCKWKMGAQETTCKNKISFRISSTYVIEDFPSTDVFEKRVRLDTSSIVWNANGQEILANLVVYFSIWRFSIWKWGWTNPHMQMGNPCFYMGMPMKWSPFLYEEPRIETGTHFHTGMVKSLTRFHNEFVRIWGLTKKSPYGNVSHTGIPVSIWRSPGNG